MMWERLLLSALPTAIGARLRKLTRRQRKKAAALRFEAILAKLGPADLCVDCGANVGDVTARLAATGATVHAFEPDPAAFASLRARCAGAANVVLHEAAVGVVEGRARLHFARGRDMEMAHGSVTSSLLTDSHRVDPGSGVEVAVIDFPAFLEALPKRPSVVKIDIEGAEVELLEALRDRGLLTSMGVVFVETHEKQAPALRRRTFDLIVGAAAYPNVDFDWW